MKHNEIDSLMRKYTAGTLTDDELQELERLTHKAETMATASRRATAIVRRRAALAVAAVMVGGASLLTVLPQHDEAPLVAQRIENGELRTENGEQKELRIENGELRIENEKPRERRIENGELKIKKTENKKPSEATRASQLSTLNSQLSTQTVVVCNNECDADSVINDIRKFLSV